MPSATGTPAAWSLRRFSRRIGKAAAQVLEVRIPLRDSRRAYSGARYRARVSRREPVRRRRIREHHVQEAPRIRQELEDVHRRNVEDRPRLHRRDRRVVERVQNAVRERGRAGGDRGLRVREVRRVHRRPHARRTRPRRGGPRRSAGGTFGSGGFGARHHAMSSSISLISAAPSAFALRTDRRASSAVAGKRFRCAVGRLALVPPAALRREDRSGGKHVGHVRTGSRRGRLEPAAIATSSAMSRTDVTPQRSIVSEVLVGLRVHVGVDQAGDDPLARGVHDFRAGRQEPRSPPASRRPTETIRPVGHDEQRVREAAALPSRR